ncbi:hypothetical protein CH262_25820 [Rhodococcus sp. 05-2255-1e]|nr:hypothetical protein CH262_25820 [Rhodococcus sp. 05-2255-1e]
MDEERLAIAQAGYSPDDLVVVAALLRVRSELAEMGRCYGRFAHATDRPRGCFATDVLRHYHLLEDGC